MGEVTDILKNIQEKIEASRQETKQLHDETKQWHDDVKSSINNLSKNINELEKRVDSVEKNVEVHHDEMEKMKGELNYLRQKELDLNMILKGIPESENEEKEDLHLILEDFFNFIGVNCESFVLSGRRVGKRVNDKPKLVQVKFNTLDEKRKTIAAKKAKGEIFANQIINDAPPNLKIYLDDQLTVQTAYLFKKARLLKIDYGIKYVWVKNGRVYIKKSDKEPVNTIKSEFDLELFKAKNCRKRRNNSDKDDIPSKRPYHTRAGAKQQTSESKN